MSRLERVVVVGNSGSGKTTVARALAASLDAPLLEMDAVFHARGWADVAHEEFLPALDEFTSAERWIVDGNYTSHGTRELVWPRADTFVWLDLPRRTAMGRVVRRTLRRVVTRERLWGSLREPFSNLYRLDPARNIIVWTWTRHGHVREKYETAMTDGSWGHAVVHRLRSTREVNAFLESLSADGADPAKH